MRRFNPGSSAFRRLDFPTPIDRQHRLPPAQEIAQRGNLRLLDGRAEHW